MAQQITQVDDRYIDGGTAIGTGLGTAINRLQGDSLSTKVIILLTDGSNNSGNLSPDDAAQLAEAKGIRVYTIGIGSDVESQMPVITPFELEWKPKRLRLMRKHFRILLTKLAGIILEQ